MDSLKVFVGGLGQHTTKDSLNQYFSQFGSADSYVMMDKASGTGRSRGFGFVNFTDEAVVQAVLGMQHEVDGVPISVSPYHASSSGGGGKGKGGGPPLYDGGGKPTAARDQLKVFVGGLGQETTKTSLDSYFGQFGFADSYIMTDRQTGRSRGFGFVNFKDETVMNAVLQTTHEVDGVQITVDAYRDNPFRSGGQPSGGDGGLASAGGALASAARGGGGCGLGAPAATPAMAGVGDALANLITLLTNPAIGQLLNVLKGNKAAPAQPLALTPTVQLQQHQQPSQSAGFGGFTPRSPSANVPSAKIFIGGLAQHTTKESLNEYFAQFGPADSIVMMDKATGRSRGFGFVDFQDEGTRDQVLQYSHQIDGVIVTCSAYAGSSNRGGGPGLARGSSAAPMAEFGDAGGAEPSNGNDLLDSIANLTKELTSKNRYSPY